MVKELLEITRAIQRRAIFDGPEKARKMSVDFQEQLYSAMQDVGYRAGSWRGEDGPHVVIYCDTHMTPSQYHAVNVIAAKFGYGVSFRPSALIDEWLGVSRPDERPS